MTSNDFPHLFTPFNMGGCRLKNRIVALPVYTGYAHPGGRVSEMMLDHYTRLARSGAAIVVVANAAVSADGVVGRYNLRIDRDEFISGLSMLADTIRRAGAVACLQLNHAGRFADTPHPLLPCAIDSSNLAFNVASLKNFMNFFPFEKRFGLTRQFMQRMNRWTHPMTAMDQERVIRDFGRAAVRAREAGFQMVELHGAGGYLIASFLSGFTNKTPSETGGDFRQRCIVPVKIFRHVRAAVGDDFPVGFRLMVREWVPDGIKPEEAIAFAGELAIEGPAYLSVSAGSYNSYFLPEAKSHMSRSAYLKAEANEISDAFQVPVIISGRIARPRMAEQLLRDNVADLIGLGRPLRIDGEWTRKAGKGGHDILTCINCNDCLKHVVLARGFRCSRWPEPVKESTALRHKMLKRSYRGLLIVENPSDLKCFRTSLADLLPDRQKMPVGISPTILVLQPDEKPGLAEDQRAQFFLWFQRKLEDLGYPHASVTESVRVVKGKYEKTILEEIASGNHGVILVGQNAGQQWRERLLYTLRGKIIALIGTDDRRFRVLVPVDLSENTLLILMFLHRAYLGKANFSFHFLHVADGPGRALRHKWRKQLRIVGMDDGTPLNIIPQTRAVSADILNWAGRKGCGTIIMGKRGLSGVKRWLMGSVSRAVWKDIGGRTLFLID